VVSVLLRSCSCERLDRVSHFHQRCRYQQERRILMQIPLHVRTPSSNQPVGGPWCARTRGGVWGHKWGTHTYNKRVPSSQKMRNARTRSFPSFKPGEHARRMGISPVSASTLENLSRSGVEMLRLYSTYES
jgi:hypothetical protein